MNAHGPPSLSLDFDNSADLLSRSTENESDVNLIRAGKYNSAIIIIIIIIPPDPILQVYCKHLSIVPKDPLSRLCIVQPENGERPPQPIIYATSPVTYALPNNRYLFRCEQVMLSRRKQQT